MKLLLNIQNPAWFVLVLTVPALAGIAFAGNPLTAYGLFAGCVASLWRFYAHKKKAAEFFGALSEFETPQFRLLSHYIFQWLLLAGVLAISARISKAFFIGMTLGVVSVPVLQTLQVVAAGLLRRLNTGTTDGSELPE